MKKHLTNKEVVDKILLGIYTHFYVILFYELMVGRDYDAEFSQSKS